MSVVMPNTTLACVICFTKPHNLFLHTLWNHVLDVTVGLPAMLLFWLPSQIRRWPHACPDFLQIPRNRCGSYLIPPWFLAAEIVSMWPGLSLQDWIIILIVADLSGLSRLLGFWVIYGKLWWKRGHCTVS